MTFKNSSPFLFLLFSTVYSFADAFEHGVEAFENEKYKDALVYFQDAHNNLDMRANEYLIHLHYEKKIGALTVQKAEMLRVTKMPLSDKSLQASLEYIDVVKKLRNSSASALKRFPEIRIIKEMASSNIARANIVLGKLAVEKASFVDNLRKKGKTKKFAKLAAAAENELLSLDAPIKYFVKALALRDKTACRPLLSVLDTDTLLRLSHDAKTAIRQRCTMIVEENDIEAIINHPGFAVAEVHLLASASFREALPMSPKEIDYQKAKWLVTSALSGDWPALLQAARAVFGVEKSAFNDAIVQTIGSFGRLMQIAFEHLLDNLPEERRATLGYEIAAAQANLGKKYESGVKDEDGKILAVKDVKRAYAYYEKSSLGGHPMGSFNWAAYGSFQMKVICHSASERDLLMLLEAWFNILKNYVTAQPNSAEPEAELLGILKNTLWNQWLVHSIAIAKDKNFSSVIQFALEKLPEIIAIHPATFLATHDDVEAFVQVLVEAVDRDFSHFPTESIQRLIELSKDCNYLLMVNTFVCGFLIRPGVIIESGLRGMLIGHLEAALAYPSTIDENEIRNGHYNLALLNSQEKNTESMIEELEIAFKQGDADAGLSLGLHYYSQKDSEKARQYFQSAERLGSTLAYLNLLLLDVLRGNVTEETVAKLKSAKCLVTSKVDVNTMRKYIFSAVSQISTDVAEIREQFALIDMSEFGDKEKISFYELKSLAEIRLSKYDDARQTLMVLANTLNYPKALIMLAYVERNEGNIKELWEALDLAKARGITTAYADFRRLFEDKKPTSVEAPDEASKDFRHSPNKASRQKKAKIVDVNVRNKDLEKLTMLLDSGSSAKMNTNKFNQHLTRVVVKILGGTIRRNGVGTTIYLPGSQGGIDVGGIHMPHQGRTVGNGRANDVRELLEANAHVQELVGCRANQH